MTVFLGVGLLLLHAGAVLASPAVIDEEWKRVKAADSPVAYARFLEAHPDFEKIDELDDRLAAANKRAAAAGRQVEVIVTRYERVGPRDQDSPPIAFLGASADDAGGRQWILLELMLEKEAAAETEPPRIAQGMMAEGKRVGSWAYFFADRDSVRARGGEVSAARPEPILAVIGAAGGSLPPAEVYLGGTPAARLITASAVLSAGEVVGWEEPPVAIKIVSPHYPEEARRARIDGVVYVRVTVSPTGRVLGAEVVRSDTIPILEAAAVRAALLSIFRPALHGGTPVPARIVLPFRFKLD